MLTLATFIAQFPHQAQHPEFYLAQETEQLLEGVLKLFSADDRDTMHAYGCALSTVFRRSFPASIQHEVRSYCSDWYLLFERDEGEQLTRQRVGQQSNSKIIAALGIESSRLEALVTSFSLPERSFGYRHETHLKTG